MIWFSVIAAIFGAFWFTLRNPRFDQNSLATYNAIGVVTIEGVIDTPPDVRDTYINVRVNADQITLPDKSVRPIEGTLLARPTFIRGRAVLFSAAGQNSPVALVGHTTSNA